MQQGAETDATCSIRRCWESLAKNMLHSINLVPRALFPGFGGALQSQRKALWGTRLAFDCTGLYSKTFGEENRLFWLKYFTDYLAQKKQINSVSCFISLEHKIYLYPRVAIIRREEIVGIFLI